MKRTFQILAITTLVCLSNFVFSMELVIENNYDSQNQELLPLSPEQQRKNIACLWSNEALINDI
jgi:hypothetical protein